MDFAVIGTLSSYVKQKNLNFAAKHKIRTGQTLTNANGNLISTTTSTFQKLTEAAKTSSDQAKQQKLRRIKQKLMNGKKISDEELGFLRVNDPKTYKKAKHAEEAREDLKAELKKAKSKSEAREAMTRAMIKASTEAMAELGALGQMGGMDGGGASPQSAEGTMNFAGDTSASNLAEGTTTADANANISSTENQNLSEGNQSVQDAQGNSDADKNSAAQKNSDENKNLAAQKNSDDDKNTPEDIMEKYIMTIRALEDEWARFTESDEYKNLPEHTLDNKKIRRQVAAKPKRIFLNAVADYRKAMLYKLYDE